MQKLQDLWLKFAQHPEGKWIIDQFDAQILYKIINEHPIKRVLDLGTGIGCAISVMALALEDKGEKDYEIHGVEQYDKCVILANELIPKEFKSHITIHKGETQAWIHPQIPYRPYSVFKEIPEGQWDLILVDGPGPWMEKDVWVDLPNGDVMKMLQEGKGIHKGTCIAWDERMEAFKTLDRYYGHHFFVTNPNPNFNFLESKDDVFKFEDFKLNEAKKKGYLEDVKITDQKSV